MTLFKNDDTLEIIYKLFQAYSYFFHQNKTEITQTLDDSETTVPSNKAVSTGLSGKVAKTDIVETIDSSNNTASDKVPSCAAVAAYVDSNISGAVDITVTKAQVEDDVPNTTLNVLNVTEGICIVRVTNLSDGSIQYKNNFLNSTPVNKKTAIKFQDMPKSANYMVEAWYYNSDTKKLIPTAVKLI